MLEILPKRVPIYIYLYKFKGMPVYVGQTPNLKRRDREHRKDKRKIVPFDGFLRECSAEDITLSIVGLTLDIPQGIKANSFENDMMDEYGTFQKPGAFNFMRAGTFYNNYKAINVLRGRKRSPEAVQKMILSNTGQKRTPEQLARMSAAQKNNKIAHAALNSPESIIKRSLGHIGIKQTAEHIAKRVASRLKRSF